MGQVSFKTPLKPIEFYYFLLNDVNKKCSTTFDIDISIYGVYYLLNRTSVWCYLEGYHGRIEKRLTQDNWQYWRFKGFKVYLHIYFRLAKRRGRALSSTFLFFTKQIYQF